MHHRRAGGHRGLHGMTRFFLYCGSNEYIEGFWTCTESYFQKGQAFVFDQASV
jgi:hypothetical protein